MKKRGQVTLFIIIGIVIVILIALFMAFSSTVREETTTEPADFRSIEVYIQTGLNTYFEEALQEAGRQGGFMKSMEELSFEPVPERVVYEEENRNVTTAIRGYNFLPKNDLLSGIIIDTGGNRYPEAPPEYPWSGLKEDDDASHFGGNYQLGLKTLPTLEDPLSDDNGTVKQNMEAHIEKGIKSLNLIDPYEHEFNLSVPDDPEAEIMFGETHTSVLLHFPINITHLGTGTRKNYETFETELSLAFHPFYEFIRECIEKELREIDFDVGSDYSDLDRYMERFSVNIIENVSDEYYMDIIEFNYLYSMHRDPYMFRIARDNRIPAMYELDVIDIGDFPGGTYSSNITYEIDGRKAIDPDNPYNEEDLIFTYEKIAGCPDEFSLLDEDTGEFEIECDSDGFYNCDIRINVTDHPDREINDYEEVTIEYECD